MKSGVCGDYFSHTSFYPQKFKQEQAVFFGNNAFLIIDIRFQLLFYETESIEKPCKLFTHNFNIVIADFN